MNEHPIIAFLSARLDEEEGATLGAWPAGGAWIAAKIGGEWEVVRDSPVARRLSVLREDDGGFDEDEARWLASHGPARVLREVKAKRGVLLIHSRGGTTGDGLTLCTQCEWEGWPCDTVRSIAAVYADHPDYKSEWLMP